MPSDHYMVEAKLLLECAPDDIPRADEVRTIIKDIWDIRMSKIRSSVTKLVKNSDFYAAVDNLTVMEINSVRPILPHALDHLFRMKNVSFYFVGHGILGNLAISILLMHVCPYHCCSNSFWQSE